MKILSLLIAFALLLGSSGPVFAVQERTREQREQNAEQVRQRIEEIKQRLDLTPEQAAQMRPILVEELQKVKALREKYPGEQSRINQLRMAREFRSIQSDAEKQIAKILSKDQMKEYKKIQEETREKLRERAQQQQ